MEAQRWPGVAVGGTEVARGGSGWHRGGLGWRWVGFLCASPGASLLSLLAEERKWRCLGLRFLRESPLVSFKQQLQNVHSAQHAGQCHRRQPRPTAPRFPAMPGVSAPTCLREGGSLLRRHGNVLAGNPGSWGSSDHVLPRTPCPAAGEEKEGAGGPVGQETRAGASAGAAEPAPLRPWLWVEAASPPVGCPGWTESTLGIGDFET